MTIPTNSIFPTTQAGSVVLSSLSKTLPGRKYLEDSRLYEIKGGFTAEVIQNPGNAFIQAGITCRVSEELSAVVLRAFNRTTEEIQVYASQEVMDKNAIWVDWLIVVRKNGLPVAFGSASFITPSLLYLNGAMVVPEEQITGIGVIANSLLWKIAVDDAQWRGISSVDIVCRTHNRNVASVLLHILEESVLSTECKSEPHAHDLFQKTAAYLKCNYDPNMGISVGVYPEGLPAGTKSKSERINAGFEHVGPRDACYVLGRLDDDYVRCLLKRQVRPMEAPQINIVENEPDLETALACA